MRNGQPLRLIRVAAGGSGLLLVRACLVELILGRRVSSGGGSVMSSWRAGRLRATHAL